MSVFDTNTQTQNAAITQTSNQTGTNAQTQTGSNMNAYTPQQQALQGSVLSNFSNYLSSGGQTPASWTAPPQAAVDWATNQFQRLTEPGLAAQFGPGSPQMANRAQELVAQLTADGWQQGSANYMNALNSAANYAFNPVGNNQNIATNGTQTATGNTNETRNVTASGNNMDYGGLLEAFTALLGGGF